MKKLLFFLLAISTLYSDGSIKEIKIHDSIAKSIFSYKKIKTYVSSNTLRSKIIKYSSYLQPTNVEEASYIILSDDIEISSKDNVLFVTDYKLLKKNKTAIGAFYWKKGRPTIIFIKERLEAQSITLSSSFEKYFENEKCLYELCF